MKFLADMGVSTFTVKWLRSDGHDAIHLRELGLQLPSVVLFRLSDERAEFVYRRMMRVLAECSEALAAGAIVSVSATAIRVRSLPIGR